MGPQKRTGNLALWWVDVNRVKQWQAVFLQPGQYRCGDPTCQALAPSHHPRYMPTT
jgi:hypothetical protein